MRTVYAGLSWQVSNGNLLTTETVDPVIWDLSLENGPLVSEVSPSPGTPPTLTHLLPLHTLLILWVLTGQLPQQMDGVRHTPLLPPSLLQPVKLERPFLPVHCPQEEERKDVYVSVYVQALYLHW